MTVPVGDAPAPLGDCCVAGDPAYNVEALVAVAGDPACDVETPVTVAEFTTDTPYQPPSMLARWTTKKRRVRTTLLQTDSEYALAIAMSALEHVASMQAAMLWI